MLQILLSSNGYSVTSAHSGSAGIRLARIHRPGLILLDLRLPDADGIDLLEREGILAQTPVIVVSANGLEEKKVRALDAGADDFVVKPFSNEELLARIRAALRRRDSASLQAARTLYRCDGLVLDKRTREITLDGSSIHLTPHEYGLLTMLMESSDGIVTLHALQRRVWGYPTTDNYKTLRVAMSSLRRKLKERSSSPRFIKTEVGVGYRFLMDVESRDS